MEKTEKKLFLRSIVSLALLLVIWLVIALFVEADSVCSTVLLIVSLIPCAYYIVYGTKLLKALGVDKFYTKL